MMEFVWIYHTNIRTQTKIKKAPKDQNTADSRSSIQTKNKKQLNQEYYQDLLTNMETHDLEKTYAFIK